MILRLKHIHRIKSKGKVYFYFRPTKQRIHAVHGTPEFIEEYNALHRRWLKASEREGTLGALMKAYRESPEFLSKAEATRADYLKVIDWLAPIDDLALSKIDTPTVMKIRDKAFKKHKRRFANYVIAVLSLMFNWGVPRGVTTRNPAEKAEKIAKPRGAPEANRPWRNVELEAVLLVMPMELRVAVALAAYAGLREGDVIALPWTAYGNDSIESRAAKTGEPIWVPVHSELRRILDDTPRRGPTIVVGARGGAFTSDGFRARFFRVIRGMESRGEIGKGLTFHGLRHTVATALADAGCDTRDIMAITGHKTEAMVARYTRKADQRSRARSAIDRLEKASQPTEEGEEG